MLSHRHSLHGWQMDSSKQNSALTELKGSLATRGVTLDVQHSSTIHDREIR